MASSSSSSSHSGSASSSRSYEYDVFLSFRGEDTRKTFVDHLYSALVDRQINTYKDDVTLPRGESIGSHLFKAIKESRIAVIVFSENYADSSWCLDELAYIMKCRGERGLVVMPVFYGVDPSDVRKQKRKFGKAFAKQENENTAKADLWRKALVDASKISGWEPKNIANGNEAQVIKQIVDTIFDKLFSLNSNDDDEDLVGMGDRLKGLEPLLDIGSGDVRMVGIWGCGGSGKTTLATSVYMKISQRFQGHCIVENVREKTIKDGLHKLQENILSALLRKDVKVHSVVEGKRTMKNMLCRRKVLVLLDDIDELGQLEALAGKHYWFGSGSRVIITTRNEHLLRTHKVNHVYPVTLLSDDEAIRLLKRHAYNEEEPVEDYETLSSRVISYASGLPLAIKVVGSFLFGKNKNEWISALDKLKDIPDLEVMDILKISYDGLETYQKELFLDIVCFFRNRKTKYVMEILEACGYHPGIGIQVLVQKALIKVVNYRFDMHDLVQEMGHYIVRGEHPNNPGKHSRLWKQNEIKDMSFWDETMEYDKTEAIIVDNGYDLVPVNIVSRDLCKIVSNMKKLRLLIFPRKKNKDENAEDNDENAEGANFLSNELRYIDWYNYPASPFPQSFQPVNLVVLKLSDSMQKQLWKGYKYLPHLKVLELRNMKNLLITPDLNGLPRLQELIITWCPELKEIQQSLGNHTSIEYFLLLDCGNPKRFPTFSQMKNIEVLSISGCKLKDGEIPCGIGELINLQELHLRSNSFSRLDFSLSQCTQLKLPDLSHCNKLLELPELPTSLAILRADNCRSLTIVEDFIKNCKELWQVSLDVDGWSDGLLQSMLKGKAIENGSMYLKVIGVEIPKGFSPPLLRGRTRRLELPENWCNDFCGFLMCFVTNERHNMISSIVINAEQVNGVDYKDDLVWEESDGDSDKYTFVWYVSFGSLRHFAWWDQIHKALSFSVKGGFGIFCKDTGFGVRFVEKKSRSGLTETTSETSSHYFMPKVKITRASATAVRISPSPNDPQPYHWYRKKRA